MHITSAEEERLTAPLYASMARRAFAFLAGCCVFFFFAAVVVIMLDQRADHLRRPFWILWLTYIVLSLRFVGTTPGKYMFDLEVRSSRPGQVRPAIWELAMRETVFRWMSFVLVFCWILSSVLGRETTILE